MKRFDQNLQQLRQEAVAKLACALEAKLKPQSSEELLHELQVHEIELEMQNEQLRQAQVELEESRDRYVDLYEFAPVGYLTLTDTGMISEINLTGATLLKVERSKLLHQRFITLVATEHRDRWSRLFVSVLQHEGGVQNCELALKNGAGKSFQAYLDCTHLITDGSPVVRITLTDITSLREAEKAMREWQTFVKRTTLGMSIGSLEERTIRLANPAYARMHGYTVEELHGVKADALYAPESRTSLPHHAECVRKEGRHSFECVRLRKDGNTFPAIVDIFIIGGVDGKTTTMVSVQDITERKQAKERQEQLFAQVLIYAKEIEDLYNHAPCGYHSLDKDGIIRQINDTELAWLGYTRDEVIGKMKWPDLITPTGLQTFRETFPQLMEQGFVRDIEAGIIRKDGTVFTGLINATAIYDPDGNFVMSRSTVTDITGRKRAEQQLRDLAAHLQTVREEEKTGIAREIHDDLGGTLTALKIEAYWLAEGLSANKETTALLGHTGEMSQLIDNAADVMHRIITGLRPTMLDDLGLLAALEWQAAQFHKRTGIECRVNCVCAKSEDCAAELDKTRSIALFRIVQESLTNVARHSGASRVEIEFLHSDTEVVMSIIDNGRGMMEKRADASIPYGMLGMSERVEQLGGKISFDTPPGGGLNVTVILPLPANEMEKL